MMGKTVLHFCLMPIQYGEMTSLSEGNPDVFEYFQKGVFSLQIADHNLIGRIPFGQTIDETVNKDTQTVGGTNGFSLKPGTVSK